MTADRRKIDWSKRFRIGARVVYYGNSTRYGKYLGRFDGWCVIRWEKPVKTRALDVINISVVHPTNLFPAR